MKRKDSQIVVAGVCALLGFLLAYQFRLLNKNSNENSYSSDVIEEVETLKKEKEELLLTNKSLSDELKALEEAAAKEGELEKEIKNQLDSARMRLGLVDVKGQGVEITIKPKTSIFSSNSSDVTKDLGENELVYLVNLLWYSRCEAISINGVRVTPQMGIKGSGNDISLGGLYKVSPRQEIVIKAIGNKALIQKGLEFGDTLRYGSLVYYDITTTPSDEIIIEKSTQSPTNNYILPVEQEVE